MRLKLNKIKSTFDITIGQFQKYSKIENPTHIETVCIFYNLSEKAVNLFSYKDVERLANDVYKVFDQEHEHRLIYKDLGFEPDLENMAAGAYGDAINYAQSIDTAHLFTAVLYRPIKKNIFWWFKRKEYNIEPYNGTKGLEKKAKDLPLGLYLGCQAFFLTLRNDLLNAIQNRIIQKNNQLNQYLNKSDSKETGALLYRFMQSLEEITTDFSTNHLTNQYAK